MNVKDKVIDLSGLKPWDLINIDLPVEEFSSGVIPEADDYDGSMFNKHVGAHVDMPQGGEKSTVK